MLRLCSAFSQDKLGHNVWAFSRLAHSKSFELPHDERDYTGNVRGEQEDVRNVTIFLRPALGAPEGGMGP